MAETTEPTQPTRNTTGSAVLVVAVLAVVTVLVIAYFWFSTDRTPHSIDGSTATTSQHIG